MKVIHVLRKPCSEPTVAANVLKHGTGALNIDGCRIYASDTAGKVWVRGGNQTGASLTTNTTGLHQYIMANPAGRWPANLVLQHLDGCVQEGVKKVAVWACAPGCPVAALDVQSGVTKSAGGRIGNAKGVYTNLGSTGWSGKHAAGDPGFGDTGGASRFFKQVKP